MVKPVPFSVLDFSSVRVGETPAHALRQTVEMARAAEMLGFKRFWVAEHHGVQSVASSATQVIIGHIAGMTSTMRVGSGGVMLPNHAPLVVAEQFGTLESLYPGRIDLGVGRASGGVHEDVEKALRTTQEARDRFPTDLRELQSLFREPASAQSVRAVPGAGLDVPIWVLASSTFSAHQAAQLGLPLAFATYLGANAHDAAIAAYRSGFQRSAMLEAPYVMLALIVTAADSDAIAQHLATSTQQLALARLRGQSTIALPPPVDNFAPLVSASERDRLMDVQRAAVTGSAQSVEQQLSTLIKDTGADEIMMLSFISDLDARHRSLEIVGKVRDSIDAHSKRW
jgi:luciferase family oxidoreductase group 1